MNNRVFIALPLFLTTVLSTICIIAPAGRAEDAKANGASAVATPIVVSLEPFAYFVEKLAPGLFQPTVMLPAGVNHDSFEPTIKQLKAAAKAQAFIRLGHPDFIFETAWLSRLIADNPQAKVINASEGVELRAGDPHVWLSPRAVLTMSKNIAAGLVECRPEAKEIIATNLDRLQSEITKVDRMIEELLEPARGGVFLVYHSALHYFADDYGLRELAIEEGGREADASELAAVLREAKAHGVRTILVEPQFSRPTAQAVADRLGADVRLIDPMRGDWMNNIVDIARVVAKAAVP